MLKYNEIVNSFVNSKNTSVIIEIDGTVTLTLYLTKITFILPVLVAAYNSNKFVLYKAVEHKPLSLM